MQNAHIYEIETTKIPSNTVCAYLYIDLDSPIDTSIYIHVFITYITYMCSQLQGKTSSILIVNK